MELSPRQVLKQQRANEKHLIVLLQTMSLERREALQKRLTTSTVVAPSSKFNVIKDLEASSALLKAKESRLY